MSGTVRPSILYAVPGHDFLPSAGPTRNVLNQARAMSRWADVTLAFRRVVEPPGPDDPPVMEIVPGGTWKVSVDDAATRGMGYREFLAYLGRLRAFLTEQLPGIDLLLEKDWMLTGWVARQSRRAGVPCIPVKNWVARPRRFRDPLKALRQGVGARLEGWLLRRTPCIVVETPILKESIVRRWRLDPARVEVIGLGVDRDRFHPSDREAARDGLGMPLDAVIFFYAGILDRTHDLEPLLRALVRHDEGRIRLHVVGDGPLRERYEEYAGGTSGGIVFHGRVDHAEVPAYIAAADLCVAPYETADFADGAVAYSTLKVREYLSAGRPVATVASGSLLSLVRDLESGFLLENTEDAWLGLLRDLPSRERLAEMGDCAATSELDSWEDVSRAFEDLTRAILAGRRDGLGAGPDVHRFAVRRA